MYCSHYALLICAMIDGLIPVHAEQLYVHVPDQALKLSINRCLHFFHQFITMLVRVHATSYAQYMMCRYT